MKLLRKYLKPELYIPCVAGTVYVLISLVNHYFFRTYYNDLGLYTNALYNYAHGNWEKSLIFAGGEHIDLWLIIFSPLSYLFGSYTLLLLQITLILSGGIGIYSYIMLISGNRTLSLLAQVQFYFSFGILTALSFDYHSNVCAAMLVPWLFFFIKREKWFHATAVFLLIIAAKENMSFWMMFVCSGMLFNLVHFERRPGSLFLKRVYIPLQNKKTVLILSVFILFSASWFIFLTQWFMPKYSYAVFRHINDYRILGNTPITAIQNFFSDPLVILKAFFINHTGSMTGDWLKMEFHIVLLLAGGWILLLRPSYLWMCLPLFAQKMLTDSLQFWGLGVQYSVEFVPVIVIGVFEFLSIRLQRIAPLQKGNIFTLKRIKVLAFLSVLISFVATFRVLDRALAYIDQTAIRFYLPGHYQSKTSRKTVQEALAIIPSDASLSAQTHLAPHAAFRKSLYRFPEINDANYILVELNAMSYYPLTKIEFAEKVRTLLESDEWQKAWQKDFVIVLKRKG